MPIIIAPLLLSASIWLSRRGIHLFPCPDGKTVTERAIKSLLGAEKVVVIRIFDAYDGSGSHPGAA